MEKLLSLAMLFSMNLTFPIMHTRFPLLFHQVMSCLLSLPLPLSPLCRFILLLLPPLPHLLLHLLMFLLRVPLLVLPLILLRPLHCFLSPLRPTFIRWLLEQRLAFTNQRCISPLFPTFLTFHLLSKLPLLPRFGQLLCKKNTLLCSLTTLGP